MANRYWGGGTGSWNTVNATPWFSDAALTTPAGATPTAADDVFFQQAATYTVSVNGGLCRDITVSAGTVTFTGSTTGPTISGSMALTAGTVSAWTMTSLTTTFNATTTGKTVTTGGVTLTGSVTFNGVGGGWTLVDPLTIATNINIIAGSFNTGNQNITASAFNGSGSLTRSITLGSSVITISSTGAAFNMSTTTNLTFNAGTSDIRLSSASGANLFGGGLTYNIVAFTSLSNVGSNITGANTFTTLTFAGRTAVGIASHTFAADQIIGTLQINPVSSGAAYRTFLASTLIGTSRTLQVGTLSATDCDFRDINLTGGAFNSSPTRAGNCQGNNGIQFPVAKTVYYRLSSPTFNWGVSGSGAWSLTNGSALDATAFPLAQDTAIFPQSPSSYPPSTNTVTINGSYNIGTIDMSNRTSAIMTLTTGTQTPAIYGNWINGTGTTISGTGNITFAGRGSQAITSATKTFTQSFDINTPGGAVTLLDNYTNSGTVANVLELINGTFNANGFNVTFSATSGSLAQFVISGTAAKTVSIGSGTWTLAAGGSVWAYTGSNLTVTGTGTISMTSASVKTFAGGSIQTYPTLNQGGTGPLTVTGSNKFAAITNTAGGGSVLLTSGTTTQVPLINTTGTFTLGLSPTSTTATIRGSVRSSRTALTGPLTLGAS